MRLKSDPPAFPGHPSTFHQSHLALSEFAAKFKNVYIIIGNHDCHYKSHNEVNSIDQFEHIPNVTVVKEYTEIKLEDKTAALCPWGYTPKKMANIDVAFGHFDFTGAALVGATHQGAYTMDQLTAVAPLCFSGHFHIRKEYTTKTGVIVSIGCPYEQNWGDVGNTKGAWILYTDTMDYAFFENVFSPKHIVCRWSKIKKFDTTQIKNNYIKLIIDANYEYEDVVKVIQAFTTMNPKSIEPEYQFQKEISNIQSELGDVSMVSHEEAINLFIDDMDITEEETDMIRPLAINKFKEKHI